MCKVYSNGYKAVKNLNVRMYKGDIFALLGHNGAGKTSTIKMITGFIEPSYGQMLFQELDLLSERE